MSGSPLDNRNTGELSALPGFLDRHICRGIVLEVKEDSIFSIPGTASDRAAGKCQRKERNEKEMKKKRNIEKTVKCAEETNITASFQDFGFDERLLKAIGELGWERPTFIQQNMIPLILENKNVTARARTGSGKTAAFMLPIIEKVIQLRNMSSNEKLYGPFALFISPTKELSKQAYILLNKLTSTFPFLNSMNFAELDAANEDIWLKEHPDMIVSTPGRLLHALNKLPDFCKNVRHVVLDEADLLLSYGYEAEMKRLRSFLPQQYQVIFTSATLNEDIGPIKNLFANGKVVVLRLKESQLPGLDQLTQYHICCQNDEERFAIFISLFKLKLIVGKSIIFVSNTNRCYQLGLFLQGFKIRSCILNAEMPVNSRCNVIKEFNDGKYYNIIASDIHDVIEEFSPNLAKNMFQKKNKNLKKKLPRHMDKESGVARGIDFHHVSNVINFDFPTSVDLYIHRVGRTARGWNKGTALSFAIPDERPYLEEIQKEINEQLGDNAIVPYEIRIKDLESFLLRTRDVLAACTRTVIREARLAEIRAEILRSKRLETYFAKNPREKSTLEHDRKLYTLSLHSPAIADVPNYIVPISLRGKAVDVERPKNNRKRHQRNEKERLTFNQKRFKRKQEDPLQSFSI
ncbi:unnamed protein product [Dracunculus medinensis]|uniref:RNA helicase n=1 Tax=Dracunculus medinensis TaxID=318479 RepID=A0A0N4U6B1_DRAME|nr:unnamed protein product [Dracunculus medinensis]